jgi:hypothetical protein
MHEKLEKNSEFNSLFFHIISFLQSLRSFVDICPKICSSLSLSHWMLFRISYQNNYNRFYFIFCYLLLFFSFSQRGINATEKNKNKRLAGPTETRTRIAGFRVRSANHYTIGPCVVEDEKLKKQWVLKCFFQMAKLFNLKYPDSNLLYILTPFRFMSPYVV